MACIAVVDDSRLARTFAMGCLKRTGHELVDVDPTSMADVLKTLRKHTPDLVLLDYLMPNCPGARLARSLVEDPVLKGVRVLMVSAHRDEDVQDQLRGAGVDAFLSKPFAADALVEAVEGLLAEH